MGTINTEQCIFYIQQCSDGVVWVNTDKDPNGIEFISSLETTDAENLILALAKYLNSDLDALVSKLHNAGVGSMAKSHLICDRDEIKNKIYGVIVNDSLR